MNRTLPVVLLLAALCLAADAPTPGVPPKAILPTRRYHAALEQAKAKYEREVEVAKRTYALELAKVKQAYLAAKAPERATEVQTLLDAETDSLVVLSASYGVDNSWADVTEITKSRIREGLSMTSPGFNIPDPAFRQVKSAKIVVRRDGPILIEVNGGAHLKISDAD